MKGRHWTAEEQRAIVLEGIKGAKPVAEICREHQMAQTQSDQWRDRFLEGGKRALTNGLPASEEALKREIEKLQRLIGKQAVAIELVKQTDELVGRRVILVDALREAGWSAAAACRLIGLSRSGS
ncbi:transposase [Nitrospira sp. Kam-Ns4a]